MISEFSFSKSSFPSSQIFTHSWREINWIHTFPKYWQPHVGFELWLSCPFPDNKTFVSWMQWLYILCLHKYSFSYQKNIKTTTIFIKTEYIYKYIYIYIYIYIYMFFPLGWQLLVLFSNCSSFCSLHLLSVILPMIVYFLQSF